MKYCYACNRVTPGDPLFCTCCGRSYEWKLCPRLHKNPRKARACAQCGSREFSTPAPKAPLWIALVAALLSLVPGLLLFLISLLFVVAFIQAVIASPRVLAAAAVLALILTVLWALWSRLPLAVRRFIRKRLLERGEERRR